MFGCKTKKIILPSQTSEKPNRLLGLDFLRFVAISLVIFHHAPLHDKQNCIIRLIGRGGWVGVDLFFVLSGFLVSGLLFIEFKKNGKVRLGRFLLRRGWRIYPPFWVMIIFSILLVDFGLRDGFFLHEFAGEALFLQNYLGGLWIPTWSLAVEEHFYFFLAAMVFLIVKFSKSPDVNIFSKIPFLFFVLAVICQLARIVSGFILHKDPATILHQSHYRMDSLMFGVLISWWWNMKSTDDQRKRVTDCSWKFVLSGSLCFVPAFLWDAHQNVFMAVFGVTLFYIGGGLLVLGTITPKNFASQKLTWLAKLGGYSYSVYLWNGMVYQLITPALIQNGLDQWKWGTGLVLATYFALSWIIGIVAAKAFEIPFLKLRERMMPA